MAYSSERAEEREPSLSPSQVLASYLRSKQKTFLALALALIVITLVTNTVLAGNQDGLQRVFRSLELAEEGILSLADVIAAGGVRSNNSSSSFSGAGGDGGRRWGAARKGGA